MAGTTEFSEKVCTLYPPLAFSCQTAGRPNTLEYTHPRVTHTDLLKKMKKKKKEREKKSVLQQ